MQILRCHVASLLASAALCYLRAYVLAAEVAYTKMRNAQHDESNHEGRHHYENPYQRLMQAISDNDVNRLPHVWISERLPREEIRNHVKRIAKTGQKITEFLHPKYEFNVPDRRCEIAVASTSGKETIIPSIDPSASRYCQ